MRRACDCGGSRLSLNAATLSRSSLPVHLQADRFNHLLRRVNLTSGLVTTLAGSTSGAVGYNNWGHTDGVGTAASFAFPTAVTIAADSVGIFAVVVR